MGAFGWRNVLGVQVAAPFTVRSLPIADQFVDCVHQVTPPSTGGAFEAVGAGSDLHGHCPA